jgi:hypothetical protein
VKTKTCFIAVPRVALFSARLPHCAVFRVYRSRIIKAWQVWDCYYRLDYFLRSFAR